MTENKSFKKSLVALERAEAMIPGASQTFSKSSLLYPRGHAPHFIERGRGSHVWDVDGNEYIDLMAALLSVVLGYCDKDIDRAIRRQLGNGISFSLSSRLESDLAERIIDLLPSAEMVRFAKNGSDVTSAAVRISRAATGRDRVIVTGYHGWHDWYVGTTSRDKGVPAATSELTHALPFNDIAAIKQVIERYPDQVAAIMLEPVYAEQPAERYLEEVRSICDHHHIVLVFDEIITGCRVHLGGAQSHYGVTPDLTCLGKALGNGMPISVLAGKQELMKEFDNVFVSGTFAGESLSLAAALTLLDKMQSEPVIESLWRNGDNLKPGMSESIQQHGLESVITLRGLPPMQSLQFSKHENASASAVQTLFVVNMLQRGVLTMGALNQMYAHTHEDISSVLTAFDETCAVITRELQEADLDARLDCPMIQSVFQVRKS